MGLPIDIAEYILVNFGTFIITFIAILFLSSAVQQVLRDYRLMRNIGYLVIGYPELTEVPQVPTVVTQEGHWKKIKDNGVDRIGVYIGGKDCERAIQPRSMDMIKSRISHILGDYPPALEEFSRLGRKNSKVIAVKIAMKNFKIGPRHCEFFPVSRQIGESGGDQFSYQQLSESCLATYYHHDSQKFLAGILIYPDAANLLERYHQNHDVLIALAQMSAEPFPLEDRMARLEHLEHKRYGRDCKKARRRVTVDCSQGWMRVRHMDYDHRREQFVYEECYDCFKDAINYRWKDDIIASPLYIPKVLIHTETWTNYKNESGQSVVGIASAQNRLEWIDYLSTVMISRDLQEHFKSSEQLTKAFEKHLPRNTLSVAVAEEGFEIGRSFQDFKPAKPIHGAIFTHKRLSEHVQATYMTVGEVEYLAGICYFCMLNDGNANVVNDKAMINMTRWASERLPGEDRLSSPYYKSLQRYGRWCDGQRVVVDCSKGTVCHLEYDRAEMKYNKVPCEECANNAEEYKSQDAEEPTSQSSTAIPVPILPLEPIPFPKPKLTKKEKRVKYAYSPPCSEELMAHELLKIFGRSVPGFLPQVKNNQGETSRTDPAEPQVAAPTEPTPVVHAHPLRISQNITRKRDAYLFRKGILDGFNFQKKIASRGRRDSAELYQEMEKILEKASNLGSGGDSLSTMFPDGGDQVQPSSEPTVQEAREPYKFPYNWNDDNYMATELAKIFGRMDEKDAKTQESTARPAPEPSTSASTSEARARTSSESSTIDDDYVYVNKE